MSTTKETCEKLMIVRKTKRTAVTRTLNKINESILSEDDVKFYSQKLESLAKSLNSIHEELGGLMLSINILASCCTKSVKLE